MPLDARKAQHLLQVVARSFAGRQRTIVIVYLSSGSYSYVAQSVIMRSLRIIDPQVLDVAGQATPRVADSILIAPLGTNFSGAVFVADTPTATSTAVAGAAKYEILEVQSAGILPGGSHLRVTLRRMR